MFSCYYIRLLSFDSRKLNEFCLLLKKTVGNTSLFLPSYIVNQDYQKMLVTIQASPHVDKKARDQYFYNCKQLTVGIRCSKATYAYIEQLLFNFGCEAHISVHVDEADFWRSKNI